MQQPYTQIPMTYIHLPQLDVKTVTVISQPYVLRTMDTIVTLPQLPTLVPTTPDIMQYASPGIPVCANHKFTSNTPQRHQIHHENQTECSSTLKCMTDLILCKPCSNCHVQHSTEKHEDHCCGNYSLMTGGCANFKKDLPVWVSVTVKVVVDVVEITIMSTWACIERISRCC